LDEQKAGAFERELAVYEKHKPDLLKRAQGQYVVVYGDTLIGPYSDYTDAYREGVRAFGDVEMLIKQILPEDPVTFSPTIGSVASDVVFPCQFSI
jgi:hypothetical protein